MEINGFTVLISGSYNAFDEGWSGAGTYACSGNYISETFKIPWYIGSAEDLRRRIVSDHIYDLDANAHPHNLPLQNAWNKYGGENFIWLLIESCPPEKTLEIEQKYLDLYRPFADEFGGFNISHFATSPMKGRKCSDEHKFKLSESHKGLMSEENNPRWGKPLLEETKEKISKSLLGRKLSAETKEKISLALAGKNLGENSHRFGKPHSDETKKKMSEIKLSNQNSLRGRKQLPEHVKQRAEQAESRAKTYYFLNPEDERIEIKNLNKFCRNNNLSKNAMRRVYSGKRKSNKGWRKAP